MLRVGIICYPTFGGSGVIATELASTLAQWGHHVHLFSYATPSRLNIADSHLCVHEVDEFTYPLFKYPPYDLALASRLIEVAESRGLDIVHAHYAIPHAISAFLAKKSVGGNCFKTVTTLHGTDITLVGAERSYFPMTRLGIEESDAVTAVSESLKKDTYEIIRPKKEIHVIPNFVNTDIFTPKPERQPGEEKTLVHVSNFRPVKRIDIIIEAFACIVQRISAKLLLIGEGPDLTKIQALVRKKNLTDKVYFLGNQSAVENILRDADLCLLASETESFGLSALEAMSCGIPVVAPRTGGLPEVVEDGSSGYLVEQNNAPELAQAALRILQDGSLWKKFSLAARTRAVAMFAKDKIVRQYLSFYEAVLSGKAK